MRKVRTGIMLLLFAVMFVFASCATGGGGEGGHGDDDTGPPVPEAPSDLTAEYTEFGVELNWTDNSDNEDGFYIYREYAEGKEFEKVGEVGPDITTFVDDTFECDGEAKYYVTAYAGEEESDPSNQAETGLIICAPSDFSVDAYYGDFLNEIDIELFWSDNSDIEEGYRIEMKLPDKSDWEELATLDADTTSYSYTVDCDEYVKDVQYRVVAFTEDVESLAAEDTLTRGMGCFADYLIASCIDGMYISGGIDSLGRIITFFGDYPSAALFVGGGDEWDSLILPGLTGVMQDNSMVVDSADNVHAALSGYSYFGFGYVEGRLTYIKAPPAPTDVKASAKAEDDGSKVCWDEEISCGDSDSGSITGTGNFSNYSCALGLTFSGPEYIYKITLGEDTMLSVNVVQDCGMGVFLLSDCDDASSCMWWGWGGLTATVPAGTYYLVLDIQSSSCTSYDISVHCLPGFDIVQFDQEDSGVVYYHTMALNSSDEPIIGMVTAPVTKEEKAVTRKAAVLYKTSSDWVYEEIDDVEGVGGCMSPPVAVDSSDNIHMVFATTPAEKGAALDDDDDLQPLSIVHAIRSDKGWTKEEIEMVDFGYGYFSPKYLSMAIGPNDSLHTSFFDFVEVGGYYSLPIYDLKHAYKAGKAWELEVVDSIYGYGYYDLSVSMQSFAASGSEVHIAYQTLFNGLKYATNASGEWRVYDLVAGIIDKDKASPTLPWWPKLLVDSDGYIYILYKYDDDAAGDFEYRLITNRPFGSK